MDFFTYIRFNFFLFYKVSFLFDINYPYKTSHKNLNNYEIESIFKSDNYKNIAFIFLARPLLNLLILDYKFDQIVTIIELIKPIIPFNELFYLRPYIYGIKDLNNKKLIFYGRQERLNYYLYYYGIEKYDFKLIFNYEDLKIEIAENIDYYDDYAWE